MINEIKRIVEGCLNNKKLPAILIGTYQGGAVVINDRFSIPVSMLSGNAKEKLQSGDKVRLLAPTGWGEYYILEIIGKQYALREDIRTEALLR